MSDLKNATQAAHDAAEHTEISKMLVSGDFTREEWAVFLSNQYQIRKVIEDRGIITHTGLLSIPKVKMDLDELGSDENNTIVRATKVYCDYLAMIPADKVWSHIYVIYMGDLFGGQMIRKALKDLPTNFLTFEERTPLIQYVRENIADADENEAIVSFQMVIHMYNELYTALRGV